MEAAHPRPQRLTELPGIGPKIASLLQAAGIADADALRQLGAAAACQRVIDSGQPAGEALRWKLEGALNAVCWRQVAGQHKDPPA